MTHPSRPAWWTISFSQHLADQLIRELIRTSRAATEDEIEQIVERMATAPFDTRMLAVPRRHRGLTYQGRTLGTRDDALFLHLAQRVAAEGQWIIGTTAVQYVDDLRRAVRWPGARLAIYPRRAGAIAAIVNQTSDIVPQSRLGPRALRGLLVVYSVDRGILISGYQFSTFDEVSIPEDALWLE